jgi:hypothetical protein
VGFFFFNLLIGWQLSIWNCCKPFFALLYNCQLLCFWRLALSTAVEVFPQAFPWALLLQGCLLRTLYAWLYALPISGVYFLRFLNIIFLLSPSETLHHLLFYLSILFLTFFSSTMFQMHLMKFISDHH